jgi:hypothetical protein
MRVAGIMGIFLVYMLAGTAIGYAAASWSWWILLAVVPLLVLHGAAQAWADQRKPEPGERVVDRELY